MTQSDPPRDFIREIVAEDVESGKHGGIVRTRFPPEPNGYLHIGHAKAICLDFGVAREFGGTCNLRMDDTNPLTEESGYVEAAARDVAWLGFEWDGPIRYASEYFPRFYELALQLVRDGLAYVDSLSEEEIREYRGTVTEPGRPSPHRDRSVEENLELFRSMRAGEFDEGEHVLRARIDMAADNMKMRDPPLYRILHASHYRTGEEWPIYPMYDWAHPLGDAIEGVTHSFCTLEFEENRELYDWVVDHTRPDGPESEQGTWSPRPRQYEFSRLNLEYTVMSKRKLGRLVRAGRVDGWDDPRLPTLAGLRRRGVPPAAIRRLCDEVGVSRADQRVQMSRLEHTIRDELNQRAPRVMCVLRPLEVVIENYPEEKSEVMEMPAFPRDVDREGTRRVPMSRTVYIERDDFREDPPEGYYRLAPGREVRLRHAYVVKCTEVVRGATGEVVELRCTYDPETRGGTVPDGRDVGGTLHWVPAAESLPAEVRLYDRLFAEADPEAGDAEIEESVNPESLEVLTGARIEPGVADDPPETRYQFFRQGYFVRDRVGRSGVRGTPEAGARAEPAGEPIRAGDPDSAVDASALVFNRIVPLRDTWAEVEGRRTPGRRREGAAADRAHPQEPAHSEREPAHPDQQPGAEHERRIPDARRRVREERPELAHRFRRYQEELSLPEEDADVLTGDRDLSDFFEEALETGPGPRPVANWTLHELRGRLGDRDVDDIPFGGTALGELVSLVEAGRVSQSAARTVLERMLEQGGDPREIVVSEGLERIADRDDLRQVVDHVLESNPDEAKRLRSGETKLVGFFIGRVMGETGGRADPELARELLAERVAG